MQTASMNCKLPNSVSPVKPSKAQPRRRRIGPKRRTWPNTSRRALSWNASVALDGETPLNRVVPCTADEPHYFCFACVEGLADTQVGMLKHEMLCMDASGCTAKLSREDFGKAIPITTFDRLELNQQQAEIMAANIEGLEQCPSCDFKAICGDVKEEPIFFCQNPECSRASCRHCQKDNHAPQTCEQAGQDKVLNALHLIEEARSEAIIRTCRKCKAKIVKEFGCNKMTCTRCSSLFCYNCNEDITHLAGNAYTSLWSQMHSVRRAWRRRSTRERGRQSGEGRNLASHGHGR